MARHQARILTNEASYRSHARADQKRQTLSSGTLEAIALGHATCLLTSSAMRRVQFHCRGASQKIMGDEIDFANGLSLKAGAPLNSRFFLLKEAACPIKIRHACGFPVSAPAFRVEVYLDRSPTAKGQPGSSKSNLRETRTGARPAYVAINLNENKPLEAHHSGG